ncbi:fibronectin type III domain-containing protein [Candidatus Neomarinimicrobiota bacterium]
MRRMILLVTSLFTFSLFQSLHAVPVTPVSAQDSLALVELYNSTDGLNWTSPWTLTNPVNSWTGVNAISAGRVTILSVNSRNLTGTIPAAIGRLTGLEQLNLYSNNLTGAIPDSICNLTNLTILSMWGNQLSGAMPDSIGNLTNLTSLQLNSNDLTGSIPDGIGNITGLGHLVLWGNSLSGSIPDTICNLTSLTWLDLSGNDLTGSIPDSIGKLTSLTSFSLVQNELSGAIPDGIGNLTSIDMLHLNDNQLSGTIPEAIGNMTALTRINLYNNQLTGAVPDTIGTLPSLDILYLYNNQLEDLPDFVTMDSPISNLRVHYNKLTFEDLEPNSTIMGAYWAPQDSVGTETDTTAYEGTSFSLSVAVGGSANEYQWYKDEVLISGATSDTLNINPVQFSDTGSYILGTTNTILTGWTLHSRPINVTVVDSTPPTAPQNLAAVAGDGQATLTWDQNAEADVLRYRIYGGASANPTTLIDSTSGVADTSKIITGLTNYTLYYYRIKAVDESLNASNVYSNEVSVTPVDLTAPAIPQNLVAQAGYEQVTLTWDQNTEGDFLRYRIYGGTTANPTTKVDSVDGAANTTAVIDGLTNLTTYYYRITAVDTSLNASDSSNEVSAYPSFLVEVPISIPDAYLRSGAWGDYDNDGDLDLVVGNTPVIYENDNGSFNLTETYLGEGSPGSLEWGDYDADGDLDLLIHRLSDSTYTQIMRNTGAGFETVKVAHNPQADGKAAWGDYDNDGDLDVLVIRDYNYSYLYRNDGNTFVPAVYLGRFYNGPGVAWGDYDNDGYLDFMVTGQSVGVRLYHNEGDGSFTYSTPAITAVQSALITWGDYDNDRDLDVLVSGSALDGSGAISTIYRNDSGVFTDILAGLTALSSTNSWGDYDNDGDLDLIMTGYDGGYTTKLYRNDAGIFSAIDAGLVDVYNATSVWGDYDNDGDLDLLLAGVYQSGPTAYYTKLYRNETVPGSSFAANTAPSAPTGLSVVTNQDSVKLSWLPATDSETPSQTLTYNIRVGTTPGGSDIVAPNADASTGYRRLVERGNAELNTSWWLDLPDGDFYWSVQAVDQAFEGSPFATEESFSLEYETPAAPQNLAAVGGVGQVTLTWDPNKEYDFLNYNIYGGTTPSPTSVVGTTTAIGHTTKLITGLTNGTTYYYSITAVDAASNESGPSNEVDVTPQFTLYTDSLALVVLYDSLDGANWTNKSGWLTPGVAIGDWEGVTVAWPNRVTGLYRSNVNVKGTLPAAIGNLNGLTSLTIRGDSLLGDIPAEIGNLTALQTLDFYNSQLTCPLPPEIGNLTNLTVLNLQHNHLTGSIPAEIGNMASLQHLIIDNSDLTGSIPPEIGNLSNLTHLGLYGNELTGTIPPEIGNLTNLETLYLGVNQLTGTVPAEVANMSSLVTLELRSNLLEDLPDLSNMDALANLQIQWNRFTFEDIEPNTIIAAFTYSPQDSVGTTVDTTVYAETDLSYPVSIGGANNVYQWLKSEAEIPEATSSTLSIPSIELADSGAYVLRITNSVATALTLYSRPLNVATVDTTGPAAPQNLAAAAGDSSVTLTWDPNTEGDFLRFRIYAGTTANPTTKVDSIDGVASTTKAVAGLTPGTTYYFRITGVDESLNEGGYSNEVSEVPVNTNAPAEPQNLAAAPGDGQAILTWDMNAEEDFLRYRIFGGTAANPTTKVDSAEGAATTTATITGLTNETMYYYRITAVDDALNASGYSNEVSVVPTPYSLETDSLALVVLYDSTNGAGWSNSTNWLTGPISTWYGVEVIDQRVTSVNLQSNNLTGPLPAEIGNLKKTTVFYLYNNHLSGEIPPEIGNMSDLMYLLLYTNQLSGSIPVEIGNLANLRDLYLNYNNLTGTIPAELANLSMLTKLQLNSNELTGTIPAELSSCTNLQYVYLDNNQLTGSFPASFEGHSALFRLIINNNELTGLPDLSTCPSLQWIAAESNQLTFEDLEPNFGGFTFTYSPQAQVGQGIDTALFVGESVFLQVSVGGTANVYQWVKGAEVVGTEDTVTIGPVSTADAGTYQLKITNTIVTSLTLHSMPYNINVIDPGFASDSLALVALYDSTDGANWTYSGNWLVTEDINLWHGVEVIDQRVTSVNLQTNNLSGPLPESIGNLTALTSLNLGTNQLTDTIPSSIGNLVNLTNLSLENNQLTGEIPDGISNMADLTTLSLGWNQLTGAVPAGFSGLTNLTWLALYGNQLTELPDLSGMTQLEYLYVSDNLLTFEDIEPNMDLILGGTEFSYMPQGLVGAPSDTITVALGDSVAFVLDVGGTANRYQWYSYNMGQLEADTTNILVRNPIQMEDAGTYYALITNTLVPYLTLNSHYYGLEVVDLTPPAPPQNLVATADDARIMLSWDQNTEPDVMLYRVYGGTESMSTALVDSNWGNPYAELTGLTNGTTYYYRVTAMDIYRNEGGFSEEVSATPSGPPVWSLPDTLYCLEDDSIIVDLDSLVADPGGSDSTLVLTKISSWNVHVSIDSTTHITVFRPDANFFGVGRVVLQAMDPTYYVAWDTVYIKVAPVNDPPEPFMLFAPDSGAALVVATDFWESGVGFNWEYPIDHDGDSLYFRFTPTMESLMLSIDTSATTLWFMPPAEWVGPDTVTGYWDVTCYDGTDSVKSANGPWPLTLINDRTTGIDELSGLPEEYALHQNYPNPFNPSTTIRYDLPEAADVMLVIYDMLGREVVRLVRGRVEAGYQQIVWNGRTVSGREVPSGIYIARMITPKYHKSMKMVLLK